MEHERQWAEQKNMVDLGDFVRVKGRPIHGGVVHETRLISSTIVVSFATQSAPISVPRSQMTWDSRMQCWVWDEAAPETIHWLQG